MSREAFVFVDKSCSHEVAVETLCNSRCCDEFGTIGRGKGGTMSSTTASRRGGDSISDAMARSSKPASGSPEAVCDCGRKIQCDACRVASRNEQAFGGLTREEAEILAEFDRNKLMSSYIRSTRRGLMVFSALYFGTFWYLVGKCRSSEDCVSLFRFIQFYMTLPVLVRTVFTTALIFGGAIWATGLLDFSVHITVGFMRLAKWVVQQFRSDAENDDAQDVEGDRLTEFINNEGMTVQADEPEGVYRVNSNISYEEPGTTNVRSLDGSSEEKPDDERATNNNNNNHDEAPAAEVREGSTKWIVCPTWICGEAAPHPTTQEEDGTAADAGAGDDEKSRSDRDTSQVSQDAGYSSNSTSVAHDQQQVTSAQIVEDRANQESRSPLPEPPSHATTASNRASATSERKSGARTPPPPQQQQQGGSRPSSTTGTTSTNPNRTPVKARSSVEILAETLSSTFMSYVRKSGQAMHEALFWGGRTAATRSDDDDSMTEEEEEQQRQLNNNDKTSRVAQLEKEVSAVMSAVTRDQSSKSASAQESGGVRTTSWQVESPAVHYSKSEVLSKPTGGVSRRMEEMKTAMPCCGCLTNQATVMLPASTSPNVAVMGSTLPHQEAPSESTGRNTSALEISCKCDYDDTQPRRPPAPPPHPNGVANVIRPKPTATKQTSSTRDASPPRDAPPSSSRHRSNNAVPRSSSGACPGYVCVDDELRKSLLAQFQRLADAPAPCAALVVTSYTPSESVRAANGGNSNSLISEDVSRVDSRLSCTSSEPKSA